jgi:hypothetical protein
MTEIKEHMEVIGADGVHVGTVDKVEGGRIKLTKKDSGEGSHKGHHHFIDKGLVAGVEGNKVRLSANAESRLWRLRSKCASAPRFRFSDTALRLETRHAHKLR